MEELPPKSPDPRPILSPSAIPLLPSTPYHDEATIGRRGLTGEAKLGPYPRIFLPVPSSVGNELEKADSASGLLHLSKNKFQATCPTIYMRILFLKLKKHTTLMGWQIMSMFLQCVQMLPIKEREYGLRLRPSVTISSKKKLEGVVQHRWEVWSFAFCLFHSICLYFLEEDRCDTSSSYVRLNTRLFVKSPIPSLSSLRASHLSFAVGNASSLVPSSMASVFVRSCLTFAFFSIILICSSEYSLDLLSLVSSTALASCPLPAGNASTASVAICGHDPVLHLSCPPFVLSWNQ